MYGKIIIAEAFLERQYQTIKPCEIGMLLLQPLVAIKITINYLGGLAGGQKYIYHGTLNIIIFLALTTLLSSSFLSDWIEIRNIL